MSWPWKKKSSDKAAVEKVAAILDSAGVTIAPTKPQADQASQELQAGLQSRKACALAIRARALRFQRGAHKRKRQLSARHLDARMEAIKQIDSIIEATLKETEALMKKVEGLKEAKETLLKTLGLCKIEDVLDKEKDKATLRQLAEEKKQAEVEKKQAEVEKYFEAAPRPKLNWAKEVEEEEARQSSTKQESPVNQEIIPPIVQEIVRSSSQSKKYYVIFNGPMPGIYDEWHKVSIHVNGVSGITHQSFKTLDEAKDALKKSDESFTAKLLAPPPAQSINRLRSLGRFPGAPSTSSAIPTIASIPTRAAFEVAQKITIDKFRERFTSLVEYKESYKQLGFYPVWRNAYGPKVIILPEASAETTFEFFASGLVDTIYCQSSSVNSQFRLFPSRVLQTFKTFSVRVVKDNPMFVKCYSTYPAFLLEGEDESILKHSHCLASIGRSNMNFPPIDQVPLEALDEEQRHSFYVTNYVGLCRRLQNLKLQTKVNYKSATTLIVSSPSKPNYKMSPQHEKAIIEFERPIIDLDACKPRVQQEVCSMINGSNGDWVGNHKCNLCSPKPAELEEAKESSPHETGSEASLELIEE
ncbi:uncharacterized protein LOC116213749 [Punica granatum]|uniref:Uncharacterized protein LOC116213749 n=1 Tax=Punica granatum TaxID=22663 RepID=A0A6P8E3Y7_PUNGR|nr:uncharacterized protein LOC116213749 [Punica granatum]XP_031404658.1 uncharacterized protein LOC116213749 [Punica granatum]